MHRGRYALSVGTLVAAILVGGWWALDARSTSVLSIPEILTVWALGALGVGVIATLRSVGHRFGHSGHARIGLMNGTPRALDWRAAAGGLFAVVAFGGGLQAVGFDGSRALTDPVTGWSSVDYALASTARFALLWALLMALPVPLADGGRVLLGLGAAPWAPRVRRVATLGVVVAILLALVVFTGDDEWEWAVIPLVILGGSATWWHVADTTVDLGALERTGVAPAASSPVPTH